MTIRIDLASTIHKCIRKLLFEQAMLLARCDFRDEASCREACAALDRGFVMLREHADHEDEVIFSGTLRIGRRACLRGSPAAPVARATHA